MALTAKQRRALPPSAFVYPAQRKYPVPTRAQARRAGIGEGQRLRMHRNALSRAAQKGTSGSYATVARKVRTRSAGKVSSVKGRGGLTAPSTRAKRATRRGATIRAKRLATRR